MVLTPPVRLNPIFGTDCDTRELTDIFNITPGDDVFLVGRLITHRIYHGRSKPMNQATELRIP
jgi:hypothetical protein